MKAVEDGTVIEIGNKMGGQGRPQKVFALTPVSRQTFSDAKGNNIMLASGWETMVDKPSSNVNTTNVATNVATNVVKNIIASPQPVEA
jgi:predicted ArsR family transcriptional regulator